MFGCVLAESEASSSFLGRRRLSERARQASGANFHTICLFRGERARADSLQFTVSFDGKTYRTLVSLAPMQPVNEWEKKKLTEWQLCMRYEQSLYRHYGIVNFRKINWNCSIFTSTIERFKQWKEEFEWSKIICKWSGSPQIGFESWKRWVNGQHSMCILVENPTNHLPQKTNWNWTLLHGLTDDIWVFQFAIALALFLFGKFHALVNR